MPHTAEPSVVLRAERVGKRYGSAVALAEVTLDVHRGELVALVGESGAGKSTLLRCFNRLVEPDEGVVLVDGVDARSLDPVTLRRRMGYVPQDGGLLPHWTVRRNAALVPWLRGDADAGGRAERALRRVGLDPDRFGERRPTALSGGERQRVALARALAADPDVVLLDEPFGALDALTRADAQALLLTLRREVRPTAVLVTHDLREAMRLADRVAVLHGGRLEQVGPPAMLTSAPATPYVAALLRRTGLSDEAVG